MAFESTFDELLKDETLDANAILHELLDPKNIDMKTHIADPITFAMLEAIISNLEDLFSTAKKAKMPLTKKILRDTIKHLKMYLVSWKRLSRKEITETLQKTKEEDNSRNIFQKLAGLR